MGSLSLEFVPSLERWQPDGVASAITIGMFDGVHLGHQGLLRMLQENARAQGLRTVVLTFDEHPRSALSGKSSDGYITVLDEKLELLTAMDIDLCAIIPVAGRLLRLEAADFVREFLVDCLAARLVVVGYDFRFGRNRAGDFDLLQSIGDTAGYTILQSEPVLVHDVPVKSTRARDFIREGNMPAAAELLGRRYSVAGLVVPGNQLGRQIGFPTANVQYPADKLLPGPGVYAGVLQTEGSAWPAAINLGVRPTVTAEGVRPALLLEAHLPEFSGDLYGKTVKLEFKERIRDEVRFENLDALKEQILRDVEQVKASLSLED